MLSLGILVLATLGTAAGNDDAMFGGDPGRTRATEERVYPKVAPDPVLTLRWSAAISPDMQISSPIVSGGLVYVVSGQGSCSAIEAENGSVLWQYSFKSSSFSTPTVHMGRLYLAGGDGYVHVLNAASGEFLFQIFTRVGLPSSPVVAPNVNVNGINTDLLLITLGAPGRELRAYNARTGDSVWVGEGGFGQVSSTSPTYHAEFNRVLVGG